MKKILIFAGTTEGRNLSDCLVKAGIEHEVCVATEYGEQTMQESSYTKIRRGRLDVNEMRELYEKGDYLAVIDCTHPFAKVVTENIRQSLNGLAIPYYRLGRETKSFVNGGSGQIFYLETEEEIIHALQQTEGKILLTTGSKELAGFCQDEDIKNRLVVRVLPGRDSLELCYENGLAGKQIIAMQGPFNKEMNLATIHQYEIACLVTKESGKTGGVDEKMQASMEAGIPCYVLKKPENSSEFPELSMPEVLEKLEQLTGVSLRKKANLNVTVAGIGMGGEELMTLALKEKLKDADYIFGAARMIEGLYARKGVYPYYLAKDIIPFLKRAQEEIREDISAVILYSGDTGFYSGSAKMRKELEEINDCVVTVLPGISSLSVFCSKIGEAWQDVCMISAHGVPKEKWCTKMLHTLRQGEKAFLLTSGAGDIQEIGRLLLNYKLADKVKIAVGYQLSYPNEKVEYLTAEACCNTKEEGLYVVMLLPDKEMQSCQITPGVKDELFIRDKVPMTKEEVREISICKLAPRRDAVIYDIGSGTGSVAFELAALSPEIKVYAIESNPDAVELLKRNREKFGAFNVEIIESLAPSGLEELPTPDCAFIGGSRGNLYAILDALYEKNPRLRIAMNAISLESICQMQEAIKKYPVEDVEITSVSVSKAKEVGKYHLMQAHNPVTIFSFTFREEV